VLGVSKHDAPLPQQLKLRPLTYDRFDNRSWILLLVANGHHNCIKCTKADVTAKNSWWWAERLPETCRVLIPIKLDFSASVGFIIKKDNIFPPIHQTKTCSGFITIFRNIQPRLQILLAYSEKKIMLACYCLVYLRWNKCEEFLGHDAVNLRRSSATSSGSLLRNVHKNQRNCALSESMKSISQSV